MLVRNIGHGVAVVCGGGGGGGGEGAWRGGGRGGGVRGADGSECMCMCVNDEGDVSVPDGGLTRAV